MNKKQILTAATSLTLVAAVSVGGTMAYFTSQSQKVVNTFVGSDGIQISLDEAPVDPDTGLEIEGDRCVTNNYRSIYPNKVVDKDPTVHIAATPDGGADLYVIVKGVDEKDVDPDAEGVQPMMTVDIADGWVKVANADGSTQQLNSSANGIYKWNEEILFDEQDDANNHYQVFSQVTFGDYRDAAMVDGSPIKVLAYAVQNDGMQAGDSTLSLAIEALTAAIDA